MAAKMNAKWFKNQLFDKHITQRQVAAALGIDPASVSLMLRDKPRRRMQLEEAEELARLLHVPVADVLANAGIDMSTGEAVGVPIVGWIDDENEIHFKRPANGPRTVEAPPGTPENVVAARYQTNGAMTSRDGWVVFFSPGNSVDVEALNRWSVVDVGGKTVLRVLRRGYTRGEYHLEAQRLRPGVEEPADVRAATPVLWVRCLG